MRKYFSEERIDLKRFIIKICNNYMKGATNRWVAAYHKSHLHCV